MALDLFAGIPVTDYAVALPWYEQFLSWLRTTGSRVARRADLQVCSS